MFEYSSVNASAYDVDSLVAKLNGRSAEGWDVVSVLSSGGDVVAILKRESTGVAAVAEAPVVEAVAPAAVSNDYVAAPAVEAAPVVESPIVVPDPAPASEPVGWGASAETVTSNSVDMGVAAAAVAVPAVAAVAAPAAAAPAAVVTTPAGWYPDPSGRFEMRYWDGNAWSEHVSRQGQQYTDPPVA
jgi:hypothetical protein